jgi:hypothetical protein
MSMAATGPGAGFGCALARTGIGYRALRPTVYADMAMARLRSTATDTALERVLEAARKAAGNILAETSRWTDTASAPVAGVDAPILRNDQIRLLSALPGRAPN